MRIAVLGSAGQLGRDLLTALPPDTLSLTREQIDLSRPETIAPGVAAAKPDVLINCAAYNFVDKAETDEVACFTTNVFGVRSLARACRAQGTKLVQISSDFVFGQDETRSAPWTESAPLGPVSVYGLSKAAGELATMGADPRNLVIRTCGLYGVWGSGGKGGNFVETMLKLAAAGKAIKVVNDQRCTPSFTADVAAAIAVLIPREAFGIVNITNAGCMTWYEFAAEIFKQADVDADLSPITSAEFNAPARRPAYSVLSNDRLVSLGVPRPRHWREALADYLSKRKAKSLN